MKVGIVTLYDNSNYGNRLQNYALQEILKQYSDEVITIKNKSTSQSALKTLISASPVSESVFINRISGKKKKAAGLAFTKKYISTSSKVYFFDKSYDVPPEKCDYYCAGSDQIWNPDYGRTDGFNYLSFSPKERNFAFAASFGISDIQPAHRSKVKDGLANIGKISVREDAGLGIVKCLSERSDAEKLIDPTLYFDADKWEGIAKKPKDLGGKKYLLLYLLGEVLDDRRIEIEKFADSHNMQIIDITKPDSRFYPIGPDEFVFLIRHADLVCTDSYHACVFSFIFDTPFAVFERIGGWTNIGSRLESLVKQFHLTDRFVWDNKLTDSFLNVDYREGKKILVREKKKVDEFLGDVLIHDLK